MRLAFWTIFIPAALCMSLIAGAMPASARDTCYLQGKGWCWRLAKTVKGSMFVGVFLRGRETVQASQAWGRLRPAQRPPLAHLLLAP